MRTFRFGVNMLASDLDHSDDSTLAESFRGVEEQGYNLFLAPDHLGFWAPFPVLAAAAATTRLRLGRRAEFGFTHVVTHGHSRDALAEVIPLIRAAEAAWVAGTDGAAEAAGTAGG